MIGLLFITFNSRFVLASFFSEEIFELSSLAFNEDFSHPFDSWQKHAINWAVLRLTLHLYDDISPINSIQSEYKDPV